MKNLYLKTFFLGCLTSNISLAAINIQLIYKDIGSNGFNHSGVTVAQKAFFESAKADWEKHLVGYKAAGAPANIQITLSGPNLDGQGGLLGQAGPETFVETGGFKYTASGVMEFDAADIAAMVADGSFKSVVFHEMAHVLGIGTLWEAHNLYVKGSGRYTGAVALAKYKRDFDPAATFVPIELDGGPGTANGHWNEAPPATPTVINPFANYTDTDPTNDGDALDMSDEVMTGYSSGKKNFLSDVTLGSFEDMGYKIKYIVLDGPYYWDAGSPNNNGTITSGNGIWNTSNKNWANSLDGNTNTKYVDGSHIFFGDKGATVTIHGKVIPRTAEFSVNGYTITGGTIGTLVSPVFTVTNSTDTLTLNSTVEGQGTFTLAGAGTVKNTGDFKSNVILKDSITLNNEGTITASTQLKNNSILNNKGNITANIELTDTTTFNNTGTGKFKGNLTINKNTKASTDANGFDATTEIINNGALQINGDQTITKYTSNGGSLNGAGNTLNVITQINLNDGSIVNANLENGLIYTNGTVSINGNIGRGRLSINSGTTTTKANIGGNISIATAATLRSKPNTIIDTAIINNSGNFILNGAETIDQYLASNTGTLSGVGVLTTKTSFSGGNIVTAANVGQTLMLSVDSAGKPVTLGAGTTLTLRKSTVPFNLFDKFTLFHNTTTINGDDTSIGFENFNISEIDSKIKGIFDISNGSIVIVSSANNTANVNALTSGLYGLPEGARFTNVKKISNSTSTVIDLAQTRAALSPTDDITFTSEIQSLSPEPYISAADYAIRKQLHIKDAAQYAPYVVRDGTWMIFSGANNLSISSASSINNADYKAEGNGGFAGISKSISEGARLGLYGAVDKGDISSKTLDLDSDALMIGAFAEFELFFPWGTDFKYGRLSLDANIGKFNYSGTRTAQALVNNVNDFSTNVFQLGVNYKSAIVDGKHFRVSPMLGFDYVMTDTDSFTETGTINSLEVKSFSKDLFLFHYGMDVTLMPISDVFGITASIISEHNFGDENTKISAAYSSTKTDFSVVAPGISSSTLSSKIEIFFKPSKSWEIHASYFQINGDDIDSATGGNLGFSFLW